GPNTKNTEEKYNIYITSNNREIACKSDYLILAVKPNIYKIVLDEIRDYLKEGTTVIGIGAGVSSKFLKENLRKGAKYIKAMPNTPAIVEEGMSVLSPGDRFTQEELKEILEIFNAFGKTEIIDESLMDGITAISGSSPVFIYMFIEAMADAGVLEGI